MKKRKGRCWKKTLYVFGTGILILSLFAGVYQFFARNVQGERTYEVYCTSIFDRNFANQKAKNTISSQ